MDLLISGFTFEVSHADDYNLSNSFFLCILCFFAAKPIFLFRVTH